MNNLYYLDRELFISKKLGMIDFDIRIEKGPWDLEIILTFANQFRKMKCTYEHSWDKEAYSINKEDGSSIWYNHYSLWFQDHNEIKEKYCRINEIVLNINSTFIEFQDTFINIKATIAIFRTNKVAFLGYDDMLDEVCKAEKNLDLQVAKIVKYATGTLNSDTYKIYQLMIREMNQMTPDIIKINDICKQVIYRIFNDNLVQTLKDACMIENEEFKYDPNLSPVHPIFGKNLTLFTMMWQNSK